MSTKSYYYSKLFKGVQLPGRPDMDNLEVLDSLPMPMISKMQQYGIAIDREYFHELSTKLTSEMESLKLDIISIIPPAALDQFVNTVLGDDEDDIINLNSSEQMCELLFNIMEVGKGRRLKRTKSGDRLSTGKKQLETLKADYPIISLLIQYKERAKLKSTYTETLPKVARLHPRGNCCPICELPHVESTHRVHTTFTTTRTDTGRLASKNPNLQNIPARTKWGQAVRAGFRSSPDTYLLSRDYSQIELRMLADRAAEGYMIDVYNRDGDIHTETAMRAFHITDPKLVDKTLHRAPCKNVNFAIVYGLMPEGLYDNMALTYAVAGLPLPEWLDLKWCDTFIADWFKLYPGVRTYMNEMHYRAQRYGFVWDRFGRIKRIPEVWSCHERIRQAGLRQAGNMPIQSVSAGLMKLAMGVVDRLLDYLRSDGIWAWPLLTIHDELIIEVDQYSVPYVESVVGEAMDNVLTDSFGVLKSLVKVKTDGRFGERWEK